MTFFRFYHRFLMTHPQQISLSLFQRVSLPFGKVSRPRIVQLAGRSYDGLDML